MSAAAELHQVEVVELARRGWSPSGDDLEECVAVRSCSRCPCRSCRPLHVFLVNVERSRRAELGR